MPKMLSCATWEVPRSMFKMKNAKSPVFARYGKPWTGSWSLRRFHTCLGSMKAPILVKPLLDKTSSPFKLCSNVFRAPPGKWEGCTQEKMGAKGELRKLENMKSPNRRLSGEKINTQHVWPTEAFEACAVRAVCSKCKQGVCFNILTVYFFL